MANSVGQHKGTDRKVVKGFVSQYGLATTFGLVAAALAEKVAGARGRSTLEERPYHFARRGIAAALKTLPKPERKEVEVPASDLRTARHLLAAWGPAEVVGFLTACVPDENSKMKSTLTEAVERIVMAESHLATRRESFRPSSKAVTLKLATAPKSNE